MTINYKVLDIFKFIMKICSRLFIFKLILDLQNDTRKLEYKPVPNIFLRFIYFFLQSHVRFYDYKPKFKKLEFYFNNEKFKFILNIYEYTQLGYYLYGPYPFRFNKEIFKGKNFIDVGANIGFISIISSKFFNRIHAFEPYYVSFENCKKNIAINNIKNISLNNFALSSKKEKKTLYVNNENHGGNTIIPNPKFFTNNINNTSLTVYSSTLDAYVKDKSINDVDLIKIDVEGHELDVILGAKKTINNFKPKIICEVSREKDQLINIFNILPKGYEIFDCETLTKINLENDVPDDCLFIFNKKKNEKIYEKAKYMDN